MNIHSTLIVFAGRTGCGKTSISKPMAESKGLRWTSFGNVVRGEASRLGLAADDKRVLQVLGQKLVEGEPERFCQLVFQTLQTVDGVIGVLDGLRHRSIFDRLVAQAGEERIKLIFIDVEDATRYERLRINRGWSVEQCKIYDDDPTEWELDSQLRKLAHLVVNNNGSVENSLMQIDSWLALGGGHR
jgi:dephospho-CoA kinase